MRKTCRLLFVCLALSGALAQAMDFRLLGIQEARRLLDPAGGARIVTLWSEECGYCKINLDRLAQFRPRGLRVVTVLSEQHDAAASLWPELARRGLTAEAWVFGDEVPERLRHALDPEWRGELPRSYLIDAEGRRQAVSGVLSDAALRAFVSRTGRAATLGGGVRQGGQLVAHAENYAAPAYKNSASTPVWP